MSIRPPFEASADPSNDERSATVSKFRPREKRWIFAVSLDKSISAEESVFFHGLNALDFIHGTTTLRVRSQVLFYFLTFLLPLSLSLFLYPSGILIFIRIFIYNTCKTMENKKWKLTQSITRYKYHKIKYYIYIFTLIWFTHGSSHPRLQVRHAWGWHVRGLNMSLLPLYHVVEVTYQEKN